MNVEVRMTLAMANRVLEWARAHEPSDDASYQGQVTRLDHLNSRARALTVAEAGGHTQQHV